MVPFFIAPNLAVTTVTEGKPWDFNIPEADNWAARLEKKKRRAMMLKPDAMWQVYSVVRGSAANLIVSEDNPAAALNGLALDFDSQTPIDQVMKYINQMPDPSLHPNFIEVSLGKKIRLVWVFERPVLVHGNAFCIELMKKFAEKIGAETLLPGFDQASYKATERWTNGGVWFTVKEEPLSWTYCFGVACEVSKKASLFGRAQIDLEDIEAEMKVRWPGRWEGDFRLEALGVRFWDENADNPTGCQVKPDGMLCFTGNTPFVKWEALFGKPWCEGKRVLKLGEAGEGVVFDGMNYWEQHGEFWGKMARIDLILKLKVDGMSDTKEKGDTHSDVERVVRHIQLHNKVSGAAPFVNFKPGLLEYGGLRFLNTANIKTVQPLPGATGDPAADFPFISNLLLGLFAPYWRKLSNPGPSENYPDPLDYFLTWLKLSYGAYLRYERRVGQAIFLCGPRNNGKTLVCNHIVGPMCGTPPNNGADPMKYLIGGTEFNKSLFQYPLLAINDQDGPKNDAEKQKMIQNLKALIVNPNHTYRPLYCDAVTIQWTGRIFVTLNDDAGSVGILPELNKNTEDKLMFFASQAYRGVWPSQSVIESTIARELPYFAHWLLNDYNPPEGVLDDSGQYRSGVVSYFDPVISELARQQLYAFNFEELLRAWFKNSAYWSDSTNESWQGSPTDLLADMSSYDSLKSVTKEWTQSRVAKALTVLAKQKDGVVQFADGGAREFVILKEGLV